MAGFMEEIVVWDIEGLIESHQAKQNLMSGQIKKVNRRLEEGNLVKFN